MSELYRDFIDRKANQIITDLGGTITPAPSNAELYRDFLNRKADDVITALNGSITPAPAGVELYRDFLNRKFDDVIAGIGGYIPPVSFPTVSGAVCSFDSQYAGLPLKSCVVDFQDGTGIDSLDFSATGKNLWGGEGMLHSFQRLNMSGFSYNDETLTFPANPSYGGIVLISNCFKPNTQYTFIITGYNSVGNQPNLAVNYANGIQRYIKFPNSSATKQTAIYTSPEGSTIKDISRIFYGGATTLYYNECGLFEGIKTVDDFVPFGDNKLFSFGKTVQNGSLNVLTGELTNNDVTPPELINLGGMNISALQGDNNIWAGTGDTTLQYIKIGGNT